MPNSRRRPSMDRIGFAEGERRNLRVESFSALCDHLVRSLHYSEGGAERAPGRVLERLARIERGLLADDAGPANLLDVSGAILDEPVARKELYRFCPLVGNRDRVEEEPLVLRGVGLVRRVLRVDLHT